MTEEEFGSSYVTKRTMLFVAFITLVVGFSVGVITGVYKVSSYLSDPTSAQPQQVSQGQAPSPERADKMLALEKEVSSNPNNLVAWTQLGDLHFYSGQFEKAIKAYQRTLELNRENPTVWTSLGVAYRRTGQSFKAVEAYDRAAEIDPRHEASRFNKAIVLMQDMNDREGAIRTWEGLLKVNPAAMAPDGQPVKELVEKLRVDQNQQKSS
ncbi:MAG: tetratricopeptide repeat protein [Deltaproteobacteria bacterium]|nr:tetratricopeptide repeat protein [Deltaproteobacteria bacterium]